MNTNWVEKEFALSDLGDKRLSKRLTQITDKLSGAPESPINQACESWGDTKAAYRFFQNDKINYKDIGLLVWEHILFHAFFYFFSETQRNAKQT